VSSVGIDRNTGALLVGWPHVVQSIVTIVTTELGERVQRRDFGSNVPGLIDRPQNQETLLEFFIAIAEAIEPRQMANSVYGEPRFQVEQILVDVDTPGEMVVSMTGVYLPDGHKGRITGAQRQQLRIPIDTANLS
jgi:phage baseplate assembly protein W